MNSSVHFYNWRINVNDYGFVTAITEMLDIPNTRKVTVQTDELNIQGKTFGTLMGNVVNAAQIIENNETIYARAKAIGAKGTFGTDKLDGIIDVLRTRLESAESNWYTDDNGNLVFEAADGLSAMMLCGSGFMIGSRNSTSDPIQWRTFGTGEGFTADLITAGVLQAGLITILGSDQFYWNEENIYVINEDDPNQQIRIGKYDGEHLGIGYTTDGGVTWQTAIGFDGIHLSATDEIKLNARVGGTNLVKIESASVRFGEVNRDMSKDYYCQGGAKYIMGVFTAQDVYNLVVFDSNIEIAPGDYILSFWCWKENMSAEPTITPNLYWANPYYELEFRSFTPTTSVVYYEMPLTVPAGVTGSVAFRFKSLTPWATGTVHISDVKFEQGSKATAWSPNPEEMYAGTNVTITPNEFNVTTPRFSVEITSGNERFTLDETGGSMDDLSVTRSFNAPNIAEKYTGATLIDVGADRGGSISVFTQHINNKVLADNVTVNVYGDLYEDVFIGGLTGTGS